MCSGGGNQKGFLWQVPTYLTAANSMFVLDVNCAGYSSMQYDEIDGLDQAGQQGRLCATVGCQAIRDSPAQSRGSCSSQDPIRECRSSWVEDADVLNRLLRCLICAVLRGGTVAFIG